MKRCMYRTQLEKKELNANARNCMISEGSIRCSLLYEYQKSVSSNVVISTLDKDIKIQKNRGKNIRKNLRIWGDESRVLTILIAFGFFAFFYRTFFLYSSQASVNTHC